MKIVFATNNAHKLEEARRLAGDGIEILSLADINCNEELPETCDTIEGNSLQKAAYVKENYGYDCFSDDTGLFVDALEGAPGVYSARYAGPHCSPDDNIDKLLEEGTHSPAPTPTNTAPDSAAARGEAISAGNRGAKGSAIA